jgi:hypothetical protein
MPPGGKRLRARWRALALWPAAHSPASTPPAQPRTLHVMLRRPPQSRRPPSPAPPAAKIKAPELRGKGRSDLETQVRDGG